MKQTETIKRHCMIVLAYYPWAETRVQREAEALAQRGYEVDVICLRGKQDAPEEQYRAVRVYRVPVQLRKDTLLVQFLNYMHFFLLAMLKATALHLKRPYSSAQVHNLPDFLVFSTLFLKLMGVPVILDLHDLMPEFYVGRFGSTRPTLLKLVRWQERMACRFADHVITVSHHWREALIRRGVPPEKCSVVMNVADDSIFQPPTAPRAYPLAPGAFRLIYHGSVVERYGLDLVVRAVGELRAEIPGIHFTVLGAGNFIDPLRRLTEELGLQAHVSIERPRPAEELPAILLRADVGVAAYRNDEFTDGLLPTKLMEYAALGLPAIASRTTAIEAYFRDTMVEFFEPDDLAGLVQCIRKLYTSPERLRELAQGCATFNARYNWPQIGAEYVARVEQLRQRKR